MVSPEAAELRLNLIDEGQGRSVLLVHGSPVSSQSFRHAVDALSNRFRVVAPDLLGFGASPAPSDGAGFELQAVALRRALDERDVTPVAAVGHDWGGPIAFAALAGRDRPFPRFIAVNTTLRPDFLPPGYWRRFVSSGLGAALVTHTRLVALALRRMSPTARRSAAWPAYADALRRRETRKTVLALERLAGFDALMTEAWQRLEGQELDMRVIWGHPDPYFGKDELEALRHRFPDAPVIELDGAGHFPQEDAPRAFVEALERLLTD